MSLTERYLQKQPAWTRARYVLERRMEKFPRAVRERILAIKWAISTNLLFLAIFACLMCDVPRRDTITLTMGWQSPAEPPGDDAVTIEAAVEEETAEEEPAAPDEPVESPEPEADAESVATSNEATDATEVAAGEDEGDSTSGLATGSVDGDGDAAETERRVLAAGGQLDGGVRISLSFEGDDDIDLHVTYVGFDEEQLAISRNRHRTVKHQLADKVWFGRRSTQHAELDVDANALGGHVMDAPCENVVFRYVPAFAKYSVDLHHYGARNSPDRTPYVLVIKYGNTKRVVKGWMFPGQYKTAFSFTYRTDDHEHS